MLLLNTIKYYSIAAVSNRFRISSVMFVQKLLSKAMMMMYVIVNNSISIVIAVKLARQ